MEMNLENVNFKFDKLINLNSPSDISGSLITEDSVIGTTRGGNVSIKFDSVSASSKKLKRI